MIVEAPGASVTTEEPLLSDGIIRGVPRSEVKVTVNDTVSPELLVKYTAEYQPPPKANWERIDLANGASIPSWLTCAGVRATLNTAAPAMLPSKGMLPSCVFPIVNPAVLIGEPAPLLAKVVVNAEIPST